VDKENVQTQPTQNQSKARRIAQDYGVQESAIFSDCAIPEIQTAQKLYGISGNVAPDYEKL
jgi:hypothetical protein